MRYLEGKSLSGQIAVGRLQFYKREYYEIREKSLILPEQEETRFLWAQRHAVMELAAHYDRAAEVVGEAGASIFAIHAMLLEDEDLIEQVRTMIREEEVTAEYAIHTVGRQVAETFAQMDSAYMRARAADIQDIVRRMELRLLNRHPDHRLAERPTILVSDFFLPSEVMELPHRRILGIVTTGGSVDSHTAQLFQACRIPALVGVPVEEDWEGRVALLDGHSGRLYLEPNQELTEQLRLAYESGGCPHMAEV